VSELLPPNFVLRELAAFGVGIGIGLGIGCFSVVLLDSVPPRADMAGDFRFRLDTVCSLDHNWFQNLRFRSWFRKGCVVNQKETLKGGDSSNSANDEVHAG